MENKPFKDSNKTSIEGFKVNVSGKNNRKRYEKAKKSRWFQAVVVCICCVGLSVFLAFFALESAGDLLGLNQPDKQIEVVITKGMGLGDIAKELDNKGVITKTSTFSVYARIKGVVNDLNVGTYILNSNMSYDQIFSALKTGKALKQTATITFYEGMSIREIAAKLEENGVCKSQEFINVLETADFDYDFMQRIPEDEYRFRRLEGYIFPDTYEFFLEMDPESVARKFLDNFDNKVTDEHYAQMKNLGLTLDQTIALASIIQEEASAEEQMGKVSSVFHNRLNNVGVYPKLQSDVTIFYVEKDIKPYLTEKNQPMYDAYNTYVCNGLPVAPIANPGIAAIEAALNPEDTEYYFFLTDVNGKYYYAETAAQHYQNDRTASKIGETHGVATQDN